MLETNLTRSQIINRVSKLLAASGLPFSIITDEDGNIGLYYKDEWVSDTVYFPVAQGTMESLKGKSYKIMLVAVTPNKILGPIEVDAASLDDINWIYNKVGYTNGIHIDVTKLRYIKESILILCEGINEKITYEYTGFNGAGNAYVLKGEQITEHNVDFTKDLIKKCCMFIFNTLLKVSKEKKHTRKMLAYLLVSLCKSQLKQKSGIIPQFILYVSGRSGSRKTSLCKLFFSLGNHDKVHIAFDSTYAAMDRVLKEYRDQCIIFDDLHPPASKQESKEYKKKAELLLRSIGDNGATRQTVVGKDITNDSIECMPVITAEFMVTNVKSSLARMLVIPIKKEDIDLEVLTNAQKNIHIFDIFIKCYISYILSRKDYIKEITKKFINTRSIFINSHPDAHGRIIELASWIVSSYEMFLEYALSIEAIDPDTADFERNELLSDMQDYIKEQSLLLACKGNVALFFEAIKDMLLKEEANLVSLNIKRDKPKITSNTIGFYDNNYVYLRNHIVYDKVLNFYSKKEFYEYTPSDKELRKELKNNNFLIPKKNLTDTKSFFGRREQVTIIYKNKFNESIGGVFNEN